MTSHKLQNSNPKIQINLKYQYSMTKTFTTVVAHHFAKPAVPMTIPLGAKCDISSVWRFEFGICDLFGICFLVLGIFIIFIKRTIFNKIIQLIV